MSRGRPTHFKPTIVGNIVGMHFHAGTLCAARKVMRVTWDIVTMVAVANLDQFQA